MDYPYINLDLLKDHAVIFHGDIDKWATTMQHAVDVYDGEKSLQCYMCWDGECYFIEEAFGGYLMMVCTIAPFSPYPVITIEKLIELSNPAVEYDFSNDLKTLFDI